jgi:hypothetical protein
MKHYIEVSGRGMGKSFRLVHKINSFLAENPGVEAILITPSVGQWVRIKEKILKDLSHSLLCFTPNQLKDFVFPHSAGTHIFFDEFDHLNLSIEFVKSIIQYRIPFTLFTTPAKRREIKDNFENDPLVYLIGENNGLYVTGSGAACKFIDNKLFTDSGISNEAIEREYLANLFYQFDSGKQKASIFDIVEEISNERGYGLGEYAFLAFEHVQNKEFKSFEDKVEKIRRIAALSKYGQYSIEEAAEIVLNKN